jgi:hypothetical protein
MSLLEDLKLNPDNPRQIKKDETGWEENTPVII